MDDFSYFHGDLCQAAVTISSTVIVMAQFQDISFLNFFRGGDILTNLVVNIPKVQMFSSQADQLKNSVELYQFFQLRKLLLLQLSFVSLTRPLQTLSSTKKDKVVLANVDHCSISSSILSSPSLNS